MRRCTLVLVFVLLSLSACMHGEVAKVEVSEWQRLPPSPLSAREAMSMTYVDGRLVVFGGSDAEPCPPTADCETPDVPLLRDGAIYDPRSRVWKKIADAPLGIGGASVVAQEDVLYVLAWDGPRPGQRAAFLSYSVSENRWEKLPHPDDPSLFRELALGPDGLVAYVGANEFEGVGAADLSYDVRERTWSELPTDPLHPSYDRRMVWTGRELVLIANLIDRGGPADPPFFHAAVLRDDDWIEFEPAEIVGGSPYWFHVDGKLVNANHQSADGGEVNGWGREYPQGGMLDPRTGEWSDLPPLEQSDGHMFAPDVEGDLVFGPGAIFDMSDESWIPVPDHPDRDRAAHATALGPRHVFVWGGLRSVNGEHYELTADGYAWPIPAHD